MAAKHFDLNLERVLEDWGVHSFGPPPISTEKSASVRLGRRGLLKTHLPEPDLDEAANGRAAY